MNETISAIWNKAASIKALYRFYARAAEQRAVLGRLVDAYQDAGDEARGLFLAQLIDAHVYTSERERGWALTFDHDAREYTTALLYPSPIEAFEAAFAYYGYCPVVKRFGVDFTSDGGALTLDPSQIGAQSDTGFWSRTHPDGWTIEGESHEDYFTWVNAFVARHPTLGTVWGDFEGRVYATSEEGFADFYGKHPPTAWDYQDI